MLTAIQHFLSNGLTGYHLKIILAVEIGRKAMKRSLAVNEIGKIIRLKPAMFSSELTLLVERRYLTEVVNPFGELALTYGLGPLGGNIVKLMLNRPAKLRRKGTNNVKPRSEDRQETTH